MYVLILHEGPRRALDASLLDSRAAAAEKAAAEIRIFSRREAARLQLQ